MVPLGFFFPAVRRNVLWLWIASLLINVGMWTERFIIVIQSLSHDYLPAVWRLYAPTVWDWGLYIGTIGLFSWLMLLFVRFVPALAISELSELAVEEEEHRTNHPPEVGHA